ncbi:MAG: hypothetical protein ACR2RV_07660 [Verrucomicrobiales bacterium]
MKKLQMLLVALMALALPSCMTIDSLITVKPDGSGTLVEKIVLKAAAKEMMAGLGGIAGEEAGNPLLDEAEYKARAEKLGAEFVSLKQIEGGDEGVEVSYKFADITKLKFTPSEGMSTGGDDADDDDEEEQPMTFSFSPGNPAKLTAKLPDDFHDIQSSAADAGAGGPGGEGGEEDAAAEAMGAQMMAMMAPMFKDMKMRVRMRFESEIVDTNATISKDNEVILMFMDFGKIVASEGGLMNLMEMDGSDREAINKIPGVKMQLEEEFEVTFK